MKPGPIRLCALALGCLLPGCAPDTGGRAAASTPPPAIIAPPAMPIRQPTRILDAAAANRLLSNKGVTLQWLDWNTRGTATVKQEAGTWHLRAAQAQAGGPGRLWLDGDVTEIGADYFVFEGTVRITDTPDAGRSCEKTKTWHFAVTQNRSYWRLREFEWCDGLTDYVDIYF